MDATLYDYAGNIMGTVVDIPAAVFPLRVQLRFGSFAFASPDVAGEQAMDVWDVVGKRDSTVLFTDEFATAPGRLGVAAPPPWQYTDTDTTDPARVECHGDAVGGVMSFTANAVLSSDRAYAAAWSWISKEDILIPEPATPTTYTFTWRVNTYFSGFSTGFGRGTGLPSDGSPYPLDPFEMLIRGFNIFSATGGSEPFSPYGDFEFGPDLGAWASEAFGPLVDVPWGYTLVFSGASHGLHVWQRA